jgi:hypothetical protein
MATIQTKPICIILKDCRSIGDLICSTPTIRKLSQVYDTKITVISAIPELFKNLPYVEASYKSTSVNYDYFKDNYIVHTTFDLAGNKDSRGVEFKHSMIDIRQFHAISLGFQLLDSELHCDYVPLTNCDINLPENYIAIHPVSTWPSRTWNENNWKRLVEEINKLGYPVVSIGKDSSEIGFFNVQKPTFNIPIDNGLDLINKTSISESWHIINKAKCFITMDSGLLHLAGTTDTYIFQLGSSINPYFRVPYRKGNQHYKLSYIGGSCKSMCASDMKYSIKQWGTIQGVHPLINCLEDRPNFDCHPSVNSIINNLKLLLK